MKTCLPIINLCSLLQHNSCVAGKHGLIVEVKEGSLKSLNENTSDKVAKSISLVKAQEGDIGTIKHEEIEGKAFETLVKISNNVIKVDTNEGANYAKGDLPQQTIANLEEVLQALQGTNKDLSKGTLAINYEDLFIRMKNPMSITHPNVECSKAEYDSFKAFKKTLTYQGKPNIATIESHKDKVFALAVAGDLLYTASGSKDIRVFRAPMFEEVDCFGSGSGVVQSLMAFEDKLYSAHQDNKIRIWKRVKSGDNRCKHKLVTVLPRLDHCVKSMLLKRNYVQVRRHKRKLWIEHADTISALALGSGRNCESGGGGHGSVLYSASWDKTVKVWSLNNFKCMESFYAHHDSINAMIVIDGSILATASADHTIKLWTKLSYATRKKNKHGLINTLEGHKAAVNALAISENFKMLYSGGSDGTLIAWKKVYRSKPKGRSNMRGAISGTLSGEEFKQNGSNGKGEISRASSNSINTAISSNLSGEVLSNIESSGSGETILSRANSLANDHVKKVIDTQNGVAALRSNRVNFIMKKVLRGHTRAVLSVSTVGDNIVCSSSADKTIRVWRRYSRGGWEYACIAVLEGHGGPVKSIASVSPPSHSSIILHAQTYEHRFAAAASASAPSSYPQLSAAEEDDQRVFVYSAGLDSKVKVWALNIPR